ncbi:MAG: choice-of-anchor L domain-containing protein [Flavobacteriaceae bacterium]|nr:choice-of-anchor L domain-containing protein [Flavobacteriaceae bacterium]
MKKLYSIIILLTFCILGNSQIIRINNSADIPSSYNIQQLITTVFGDGFGTISNFSSTAESGSWTAQTKPYGYFNQNGSTFPFQNGVVITSGKAYDGGNTTKTLPANRADTNLGIAGDVHLTAIIANSGANAEESQTHDAFSFEFDFKPMTQSIKFDYIFASSEYDRSEFNCSHYDGIAILVKKAGDPDANYVNYAVANIGGTNYLVNAANISPMISNGSVNCGKDLSNQYFAGYYWGSGALPQETNYMGRTKPLTVNISVTAGQTYHIKFVVADNNSASPTKDYDSALFLKGADLVVNIVGAGGTQNGAEYDVCGNNFTLTAVSNASDPSSATYQWSKDGTVLSGETGATLNGTYGAGVYSVTVSTIENSATNTITVVNKSITLNSLITTLYDCPTSGNQGTFDLTSLKSQLSPDNTLIYSFFTDSGLTQAISNPQNYISEEKTIYVKAQNSTGCTASQAIALKIINIPDPIIQQTTLSCQTVLSSSVSYPAGVQFVWLKNGSSYTSVSSVLNPLTITETGNYSLQVSLEGCSKTSNVINASASTAPIVNLNFNGTAVTASAAEFGVCSSDFKITSTVTNATGSVSYQWSKDGTVLSGETNSEISGINYGAGTYTLSVTDSLTDCTGTSLSVKVIDKSFTLNTVIEFYGCRNGDANQGTFDLTKLENLLSSNNTLIYSYFSDENLIHLITISDKTQYQSSEIAIWVQAVNGTCSASQKINLKFTNIPNPVINQTVTSCTTILYSNTSYSSGEQFVWLKDGSPYTSVSSVLNPLTITETGNYSLQVSLEGCSKTSAAIPVIPVKPIEVQLSNLEICEGQPFQWVAVPTSPNFLYEWTDAGGTVLGNDDNLHITGYTAGTYSITLTINDPTTGCQGNATAQVIINPLPVVNNVNYTACDYNNDGSVIFNPDNFSSQIVSNPNNYTIQYVDSGGNTLSKGQNISQNQIITAKVTSAKSCESEAEIQFNLNSSIPVYTAPDLQMCDNGDGTADFNLSSIDINSLVAGTVSVKFYASLNNAENGAQELPNNYTSGNAEIYAVAKTADGDCGAVVKINLKVLANPVLGGLLDVIEFCPDGSVNLEVPAGFSDYKWSTGAQDDGKTQITVTEPGSYTVTVYNASGCQLSHTFTVKYYDLPMIIDVQTDDKNGKATVIVAPSGTYKYSLDQINWQVSNVFTGLKYGVYSVWLRAGGQGCVVGPYSFAMLGIPNVITPNGDGINDVWTIKGLEAYSGTQVRIFDRYGRTVFEGQSKAGEIFSWDGTFKGSPLTTTTYWYILVLPNGKKITGYVVVKK